MKEMKAPRSWYEWSSQTNVVKRKVRKSKFYKKWRRSVIMRDHFSCIHCNTKHSSWNLHVHHIISFRNLIDDFCYLCAYHKTTEELIEMAPNYAPLWDMKNAQTLCIKCHALQHPYSTGFLKFWGIKF